MNLNFKNSKKLGMLLGVILFTVLAVGVTYAVIVWRTTDYNVTLNSKCLVQGNFTKGSNISGADLLLLDTSSDESNKITIKNGMTLSNFSVSKDTTSNCTIDGYVRIALNVTNLPTAYTTSGNSTNALKYALFYYDPNTYPTVTTSNLNNQVFTTLTKGSITQNGTMDIYYDTLLNNGNSKNYILAIYLDGSLVSNDASDSNFTASVETSIEQVNKNTPTVTFDPNGGTVNTTSKVVKLNEPYGDLPIPTREGYTFLGWNGKNMFDGSLSFGNIDSSGNLSDSNTKYIRFDNYIYVGGKQDIVWTIKATNYQQPYFLLYDENYSLTSRYNVRWSVTTNIINETSTADGYSFGQYKVPLVSSINYLKAFVYQPTNYTNINDVEYIQLEEGTTATPYEPYYVTSSTIVTERNTDYVLTAIWEEDSE